MAASKGMAFAQKGKKKTDEKKKDYSNEEKFKNQIKIFGKTRNASFAIRKDTMRQSVQIQI